MPCQEAGFAWQRCPKKDVEHSNHQNFVHRKVKDKKEQGLQEKHALLYVSLPHHCLRQWGEVLCTEHRTPVFNSPSQTVPFVCCCTIPAPINLLTTPRKKHVGSRVRNQCQSLWGGWRDRLPSQVLLCSP